MLLKLTPPNFWYQKDVISYFLLPFSFIYRGIGVLRKFYYQIFPAQKFPIPVIVIGNITVGGTGKTPLAIYLANFLKSKGYYPGIISRGYGGNSNSYPLLVTTKSRAEEVGDEALLIASYTGCPVVVAPKRISAVKKLLLLGNCNVVISDDGLQHYALLRDIEIAVVDAKIGFGNGFCLPAGPLRESPERLRKVDFVVKNYNTIFSDDECGMVLEPVVFYNLKNPAITKTINEFICSDYARQAIHAVAGIGNPSRFFQTLRQLGLNVIEHPFPDHYVFQLDDFLFESGIIVMTEKDAVKCFGIASENCWCLKVEAKLNYKFMEQVLNKLNKLL